MIDAAAWLMLLSGAAHAVVNTILKSGSDMMSCRALIDGSSGLFVLPLILIVPLPDGAWHWLAASLALHLVYLVALVKAFETAEMSATYPVMRGSAPVIASLAAVAFIGDPITPAIAGGILMVSVGTMAIALWQPPSAKALGWALLTGTMIAAYTVVDAMGARQAPSAPSYIAWIFLLDGLAIAGLFAWWRGPVFILEARKYWKPTFMAGALSIVTYGSALWAYRIGDVPRLAALRETSILFAVLLAVVVLKERVSRQRALGAMSIAAGAAVLVLARS